MNENQDFVVTPYEVKGDIDYAKLVERFGVELLDDSLIERIKKHTGELHPMLRRGIYFCHRDMNFILDEYEKGNKFYLYTGRGPSGITHLGHLVPSMLTKWLQDKFDTKLIFQITDDEKFFLDDNLSLDDTRNFAFDNILDVIASGFDPKKTEIIIDSYHAKTLYPLAARVAKKITFSTVRGAFGFDNSSNIGKIFYTAMQAVPAMLETIRQGKKVPCLIPHAIDQDPHFRVSRDVMEKLGYYKMASIQSIFLPGLSEGGKMSSSIPDSAIFVTDTAKTIKKKIGKAFTGGRETVTEQREKGGDPSVCMVFANFNLLFIEDDKELEDIKMKCLNGELLCGECKQKLTPLIQKLIAEHQEKREKARDQIDDFLFKDFEV